MTEQKMLMKPYPLGAHCEAEGIRFSYVSDKEDCGVILYHRTTGKCIKKIPFLPTERVGRVYCKYVDEIDREMVSYQFYEEERVLPDERARAFENRAFYGKMQKEKNLRAIFPVKNFDWEKDHNPMIHYEDCIVYCMHVRGFTKHASSNVVHRGTFLGITEKIDYLQEIGITTVELQPAYDFFEVSKGSEAAKQNLELVHNGDALHGMYSVEKGLNYWGYKKGFYYTPKASYAAGEDAQTEFKTMVKEFHKKGMEVVMQFYFPNEVPLREIPEILRFWVLEYHVDGFHLLGERIPIELIVQDGVLAQTKLWHNYFDEEQMSGNGEKASYVNLAVCQDEYYYDLRKFLKGDENMLNSVLYQMRYTPEHCGRIHSLSNYYGFTLMDMVSYDYKHNEANGEENRDGNDYNCSWNCGEEGATRKKKINRLRLRQIKNAMTMLLFSKSTPLIFMGDEFGNSQQGNNNPYCQDNRTTWLNWSDIERNRELFEFWKRLVKLRREHPVFHTANSYKIMDYVSCGYPDLSYHGQYAWRPQLESYHRHVGIMYCGKYVKRDSLNEDDFFYVALNMHWVPHELALPKLPKELKWEPVFFTAEKEEALKVKVTEMQPTIPPRSIAVFKSALQEGETASKRKRGTK